MSTAEELLSDSCVIPPFAGSVGRMHFKKAALPISGLLIAEWEQFGKERFAAYVCGNT